MKYYTIYDDKLLISSSQDALKKYYDTPIFELPEDYEPGKYIIGEVEEEIINPETGETEIITVKKLVPNPNWDEEQVFKRKANFESQFLLTSLGQYRLQPKGYANAQQSIDTVDGMVMKLGGLNEQVANMVIFYDTPDFTKPEECTEEWLLQHQHHPEPMTLQEWSQFYIEFAALYAQKQYRQEDE